MFRDLEYQRRVTDALDAWLDALKTRKATADQVAALAAQNPGLNIPIPDFPAQAWSDLHAAGKLPASRAGIAHARHEDGCSRPVPHAVLKVPTGGGKTWLAISALSRIFGRYLGRNTGFVLWIVPNEAIYTQTIKYLKNRDHPYRQALDRAAANRVRILEKSDRLDARDVEANLCVMLLMLQSSNRANQETLRMFRDRGDISGFTPPESEQQAHQALRAKIPNLDVYGGVLLAQVKDSLGNALRILRPVVILDEGHRAISDLAHSTLYGFNPSLVLELTATPKDIAARSGRTPHPGRTANILVEITGRDLDHEDMIKMPLNLDPRQGTDWRATIGAALDRLRQLDAAAERLRADTNRYIRPIMLIQVERTGDEQRGSGHIHAQDVRDWLLSAGLDAAEIAIKTAQQNDLSNPENQDLLSPTNRIRAIITKQALQEGWDCPFAYVLCSLAASTNSSAMTQLVGRILRQPGAQKTGISVLDECHVITHHAATSTVVSAIKAGLENDGLGDLVLTVATDGAAAGPGATRAIERRRDFDKTEIYLPRVLAADGAEMRDLDYETDILSAIDWRGFDPAPIAAAIPENARPPESQLQRITLAADGEELVTSETIAANPEILAFDPVHAVRMISDIVVNPFIGRDIVTGLLAALRERGFTDARIGELSGLITDELRKALDAERDRHAEVFFKAAVQRGDIQFRLRLDGRNWRMPHTTETTASAGSRQMVGETGGPLERSLFAPIYEADLNTDEQAVAMHLDGTSALLWWHRNVARAQYALQGWRRGKIYPDFLFATHREGTAKRIAVLEMKGDHLQNGDTNYKREVLCFLSHHFSWDNTIKIGQLQLVNTGETVDAALIMMNEWPTMLPAYIEPAISNS